MQSEIKKLKREIKGLHKVIEELVAYIKAEFKKGKGS